MLYASSYIKVTKLSNPSFTLFSFSSINNLFASLKNNSGLIKSSLIILSLLDNGPDTSSLISFLQNITCKCDLNSSFTSKSPCCVELIFPSCNNCKKKASVSSLALSYSSINRITLCPSFAFFIASTNLPGIFTLLPSLVIAALTFISSNNSDLPVVASH